MRRRLRHGGRGRRRYIHLVIDGSSNRHFSLRRSAEELSFHEHQEKWNDEHEETHSPERCSGEIRGKPFPEKKDPEKEEEHYLGSRKDMPDIIPVL